MKASDVVEKLVRELQEVVDWTVVEEAPLRKLELDSIAECIRIGKKYLKSGRRKPTMPDLLTEDKLRWIKNGINAYKAKIGSRAVANLWLRANMKEVTRWIFEFPNGDGGWVIDRGPNSLKEAKAAVEEVERGRRSSPEETFSPDREDLTLNKKEGDRHYGSSKPCHPQPDASRPSQATRSRLPGSAFGLSADADQGRQDASLHRTVPASDASE